MKFTEILFDKKYKKAIKWLWITSFGGVAILAILVMFLWNDWVPKSYKLPPLEELENPTTLLASEVYSSDGILLGKYFLQNRSNASFEELSPQLINALIATEDVRFYDHSGIDFRRVFTGALFLGTRGGASTITQQLAKNLFPRKKFNNVFNKAITKFKEWITAIRIEQRYTKQEILTMYFNTVEFGGNAFGIRSAAKVFFGKSPKDLNAPEAALLVGMLKGITKFNPNRNPANALNRRNTVLNQMLKNGYLTEKEAKKLKKQDIKLNYEEDDHNEGLATYFREYLRGEITEWADENGYNLYKDGLKIYTTINAKLQSQAELAVSEHLKTMQKKFYAHWKGREPWGSHKEILLTAMKRSDRYKICKEQNLSQTQIEAQFNTPVKMKVYSSARGTIDTIMTPLDSLKYYKYFLQCGMMSVDPRNGQVKVWVGGNDYKHFKYDHVNQNSKRQVGSTFKPFVYTLAIDNGISPCNIYPNKSVQFEGYPDYNPGNADEQYTTPDMTMYRGLQFSVNLIALQVLKSMGSDAIKQVINIAKKMGVESPMGPYPATALGTADISVFEMTGAFSTFANKGVWIKPNYLLKITDKNGNTVFEPKIESREALSEQTSYVMCKMLEKVTTHGTAAKIKYQYGVQGAVGGKTGTTQNYSDGWFIGITPTLTTGIWTGFEERAIHFRSMDLGSGSAMAMPIFGNFMKSIQSKKLIDIEQNWAVPKMDLTIELDCDKYKIETKTNSNDDPFTEE